MQELIEFAGDVPIIVEVSDRAGARGVDVQPVGTGLGSIRDNPGPQSAVIQYRKVDKGMTFMCEAVRYAAIRLECDLDQK